jgi:hypothetical protein
MAEKGNGEDPQANLELPSMFGRKKKASEPKESAPVPPEPSEPASEPVTQEPVATEPARAEDQAPVETTRPLFVDDLESPAVDEEPAPVAEEPAAAPAREPRPPRDPLEIHVPGMVAAVITGLVVGGLTVGLTYLGLEGCDAAQGTESCGGPGFFILVAILVLMVVTGSWLLKVFAVTDPGSTSFLAVGLAVVIALLFLIEVIFEWWMVIAMPLVFVATYVLAHWVTVRYIEPASHT